MKPTTTVCPCGSQRPYAECCAPYHRGEREPPNAEALMRSRYSAFAVGEADYLLRTLHPDHDDRARADADLREELRRSARTHKYMGLTILDTAPPDEQGIARVLFCAKV